MAINPGSPLRQAETWNVQELPPLVLWEAPECRDSASSAHRSPHSSGCADGPRARARESLGRVTFCIRGRRACEEGGGAQLSPDSNLQSFADCGYSIRQALIVKVDEHILLMPIEPSELSPGGSCPSASRARDDSHLVTLPQWLRHVRRESSCKAPLPRQWQSLPLESLIELAIQRGLRDDEAATMPRIKVLKFLRGWAS